MARWRGAGIGAGYFSRFHYEAWARIPEVEMVAVCDLDEGRARAAAAACGAARFYVDYRQMLDAEKPDFADVITRPETHLAVCREAFERGIAVICQKPLAPAFDEAKAIVEAAERSGARFMVHENFRFQPWHREIRRLIETEAIGERLHSLAFRSRPGDGWGPDAYSSRQPYFRDMPRFLIHETGIHVIDVLRFLAGEIARVYCLLRRLNPAIAGEDCGLCVFEFASGAVGQWDANRWNESSCADPRYTFGDFLVEGSGGSIRLGLDGALSIQPLGQPERPHPYPLERRGFAGDCVHAAQRHFIERLQDGGPFETGGREYLRNLAVEEALYRSALEHAPVAVMPSAV